MTRSTFSGFTIAQLAMASSQRALDVTGQNIANINTKGYTRQRVDLVSLNLRGASPYSTNPGSKIGYGVEIAGISQIRDPFLDVQYRNQIAKVGTADGHQATLDELADIFDETDTDALKKALSDLSSSLDKLSSNAGNSEFDSIVRSRCQVLLNYIHQKAADLSSVREGTLEGLEKTDIPTVNGLLSDIGELNDTIWKSQVLGNPSLELLDQRNNKLDELASYLPISVTYKEVELGTGNKFNYPVVTFNGSDGMTFPLTGGEHGENFASLSMDRNVDHKGKPDGTVSIHLIPASDLPAYADTSELKTDITNYLKEGSLQGTVDMLNKSGELDSPATDYRGIGYYEKAFDSFVQSFANTLNDLNGHMHTYTGTNGMPTTGNAKELTSTGAELAEFSIGFSKTSGNFLENETITVNGTTLTFGDGTKGTIKIGSTLQESMVNLADKLSKDPATKTLDVAGTPQSGTWSYDGSSKKMTWKSTNPVPSGTEIKSDSIKMSSFQYKAYAGNVRNFDLFQTTDGSKDFSASNIKIADDWMNNSIHIVSSHDEDAGSTANDNIIKMLKSLTEEREFKYKYTYMDNSGVEQTKEISYYKGSYSQCYSNLENTQGIDSKANKAILINHISVLNQTADSKDSVSGVSLDEEGIDLMHYQRSYTAAARLMTTLDEALDVLINKTGIVGR
ncbi:flagellar basal body rod C-terminal domain-containing protein [Clostridium sp. E02]|uniref:flagellar hook-associated protein FlgK n=1 Tax=Clostridium sp. E02 TaxID=2487134 RepID=UPI0013DDD341|nr:flagellar basal body rod C-terminal domain-containing protein [Clostridium sp. E02]